jgi:hypothetical protein
MLAHVLKAAGNDLSRENILRQALSTKGSRFALLLPGITISTRLGPSDYRSITHLQAFKFDGAHWVPTGSVIGSDQ